jgi:hypothetical protein
MMHDELTKIAAERSPEKRLELLHKVTDLYLDGVGQHTTSERAIASHTADNSPVIVTGSLPSPPPPSPLI